MVVSVGWSNRCGVVRRNSHMAHFGCLSGPVAYVYINPEQWSWRCQDNLVSQRPTRYIESWYVDNCHYPYRRKQRKWWWPYLPIWYKQFVYVKGTNRVVIMSGEEERGGRGKRGGNKPVESEDVYRNCFKSHHVVLPPNPSMRKEKEEN